MDETKYVIVQDTFGKFAIVFDAMMKHSRFERGAIAAGFVNFSKNQNGEIEVYAYGNSISLGLKSREAEDDKLICQALNGRSFGDKLFIPAKRG